MNFYTFLRLTYYYIEVPLLLKAKVRESGIIYTHQKRRKNRSLKKEKKEALKYIYITIVMIMNIYTASVVGMCW